MSPLVTRSELRHLLSSWQAGALSAAAVHAWAEARYAVSSFEPEDEAVNEVLANLDKLDMNLITVEDVPALQQLLGDNAESLERALASYDAYFSRVDFARRRQQLAEDPLYARFCGAG